jgi:hypothetical protein
MCLSALPLSQRLVEDRAAALVFSFPIGYIIHAVLLSVFGLLVGAGPTAVLLDFGAGAVLFFGVRRFARKTALNGNWEPVDTLLLALWLLCTALLVAPAFVKVGVLTSSGYAYRAYFNADFFRNMAVSGALAHTGVPPDNPYFGGMTLHYYWFFHIVPACWERLFPSWPLDLILVQFSMGAVLVFASCLFVTVRSFVSSRKTLLLLFPLFAFGGSYKGLYILNKLHQQRQPFEVFTTLNVDGILRWDWNAPQIDTLYRALLYAPQHLIPLAIVLLALYWWNRSGQRQEPRPLSQVLLMSFLVFATLGFSTFVGVVLTAGAGLALLFETYRQRRAGLPGLVSFAVMGLLFVVLYLPLFRMFEAGGTGVRLGPDPNVVNHLGAYILLNWGALGILGVAGLLFHSPGSSFRPLVFFLCVCATLIFFVELNLPGFSDISLKMGHFSHVILLCLAAGFLDRLASSYPRRIGWIAAGLLVLVLPASLTWIMDSYNSRDIGNKKFTTVVSLDDREMLDWMSHHLPPGAVVQEFSLDYNSLIRDFVSIAPPFAQRPVYLGDRIFSLIFQVPPAEQAVRKKMMSEQFKERDPEMLAVRFQSAGVGYLFVESKDASRLPEIQRRLASPWFSPLFQSGNSFLYRVNGRE